MELRRLLVILRRRLVLLVVLIVAGVVAAYLGSARTSVFQAQSTLYVTAPSTSDSATAQYGNDVLASSLAPLVAAPSVIQRTIMQSHLPRQVASVVKASQATVVAGSSVIRVTVQDRDPVVAQTLANGVATVFVMDAKSLPPIVIGAGPSDQTPVSVAQRAVVPGSPLGNNLHRDMGLGGLVGLLVGLAVILVVDFLGLSARTPRQLEDQMGMPVIGVVPFQAQVEHPPAAGPDNDPEPLLLLLSGDDG